MGLGGSVGVAPTWSFRIWPSEESGLGGGASCGTPGAGAVSFLGGQVGGATHEATGIAPFSSSLAMRRWVRDLEIRVPSREDPWRRGSRSSA